MSKVTTDCFTRRVFQEFFCLSSGRRVTILSFRFWRHGIVREHTGETPCHYAWRNQTFHEPGGARLRRALTDSCGWEIRARRSLAPPFMVQMRGCKTVETPHEPRSSRRKEALAISDFGFRISDFGFQTEPPYVGCYDSRGSM